jgi:hypothetical protein
MPPRRRDGLLPSIASLSALLAELQKRRWPSARNLGSRSLWRRRSEGGADSVFRLLRRRTELRVAQRIIPTRSSAFLLIATMSSDNFSDIPPQRAVKYRPGPDYYATWCAPVGIPSVPTASVLVRRLSLAGDTPGGLRLSRAARKMGARTASASIIPPAGNTFQIVSGTTLGALCGIIPAPTIGDRPPISPSGLQR